MSASPIECLVARLHRCRETKNLAHAKHLHAYMREHQLETHGVLGNLLVSTLVSCGSLPEAQHVFHRLPYRNQYSWTSIISGHIACGRLQHAVDLYHQMLGDSVPPNHYTFLALLKACDSLKHLETDWNMHTDIVCHGLDRDLFMGNSLIDMYSKSGLLADAAQVFAQLPFLNVISWNTLIAGYADHGASQEAITCFEQMQLKGVPPDDVTFSCALKACGTIAAIEKGELICIEVVQKGFERDLVVSGAMIDMFAKCGALAEAQDVFDQLAVQNVVSWTALIAGYAEHGFDKEAMICFEHMQLQGVLPDVVTFPCSLKSCGITGNLETGKEIHAAIVKQGLEGHLFVGNKLVDLYAKCGSLAEAQDVLDKLSARDAVSWNALIAGYVEHGFSEETLSCYTQMQLEGVAPSNTTFPCCLKASGSIKDLQRCLEIHTQTLLQGCEEDPFINSTLVDVYGKCGFLAEAHQIVTKLSVQELVSWNALIAGYVDHGLCEQTLECLEKMQLRGVSPDTVTYVCSLKVCTQVRDSEDGQQIHAEITKRGWERVLFVTNTLVDMYGKLGLLVEAQGIFNNQAVHETVSWNALIAAYSEHGIHDEVMRSFEQMLLDGVRPTDCVFLYALKACGILGDLGKGQIVHDEITKRGWEGDPLAVSTMLDMYSKCGLLAEACELFDQLPVRDTASWNALISGLADHGLCEEALNCFEKMQLECVFPDHVTFLCCLRACGIVGALVTGQRLHTELTKQGLESDLFMGNTLVGMYSKCNTLLEGRHVFDKMPVKDVVSWTAMIKGYGENHAGDLAVEIFESMLEQGVKPNAITFTCLLAACSHASLVSRGQEYFELMKEEFRIKPAAEHFACMVDLLARSGRVHEAQRFAEDMQGVPSEETLRCLLTSCRIHGEVELGLKCFQQLVLISQEDAAAYLLMADVYTNAGQWSDAKKIEGMRTNVGAKKVTGSASIQVAKDLYEFVVGDAQGREVLTMIGILCSYSKDEGYVPNLGLVLAQLLDEDKETCYLVDNYFSCLTCNSDINT